MLADNGFRARTHTDDDDYDEENATPSLLPRQNKVFVISSYYFYFPS